MAYHIFLNEIELPIPPASIDTVINGRNETIELIDAGEYNVIKPTGLTDISFSVLLPNSKYPFASGGGFVEHLFSGFGFKNASFYINKLQKLKDAKKPLRLLIVRNHFNHAPLWHTNMLVTLEGFTVKDTTEEGVDNVLELSFKQYRFAGTKKLIIETDENGNQTYTVEQPRYTDIGDIPSAIKITNETSILEAVEGLRHGLDWQAVAVSSGITNPLAEKLKGKVLGLGKHSR